MTIRYPAPTRLELIDCEPLRDVDGVVPGYYLAACGINADRRMWRGCLVQRSLDSVSFEDRIAVVTREAAIGVVIAPGEGACTVRMLSSRPTGLLSTTFEALTNNANLCIVGNRIAQYVTATLIAPRIYNLAPVVHAYRTLDVNFAGVPMTVRTGDRFVFADDRLHRIPIDTSLLGKELVYVATTIGQSTFQSLRTRFTCNASWWNV